MTSQFKMPTWALLICKCLAVPLGLGAGCGIFSNLRHLERFGLLSANGGYAVAGLVFAAFILWMCLDVLRMPIRTGQEGQ